MINYASDNLLRYQQIMFIFNGFCSLHFTADGSSKYMPEANRYHLYVSYACPWANRTLIVHKLKGLENVISVDVVEWLLTDKGWSFNPEVLSLMYNITYQQPLQARV